MAFTILSTRRFALWWKNAALWHSKKFKEVTDAINNIHIPDTVASETNATANKDAILAEVAKIPTLTYTEAIAAIKSVVDTLPKSTLTAQDKADIIAAIQSVMPTIDFTAVLNAIASSEASIKQAMPTDYAKRGEALNALLNYGVATTGGVQAAQAAAQAAKTAAENITLPTNLAKESANGAIEQYAKQAAESKTAILTAIAGVQASSYKGVPTIAASGDITAMPNQLYVWGSAVGALTITKGAETAGIVNEYIFRFSGATSVVFAGWELTWNGGDAPSWDAEKTYEISIVDNIALYAEL